MIPSLAIHMNREANKGVAYNPQKDMLPLTGLLEAEKADFMEILAEKLKIKKEDILTHDLFLYNRMPGTIWGADREFVSSPRLDDLQCAFASMEGMLRGGKRKLYCRSTAYWIMKKWEAAQNRVLHLRSLKIHCGE